MFCVFKVTVESGRKIEFLIYSLQMVPTQTVCIVLKCMTSHLPRLKYIYYFSDRGALWLRFFNLISHCAVRAFSMTLESSLMLMINRTEPSTNSCNASRVTKQLRGRFDE